MNGRRGKIRFAQALLLLFAVMLVLSLLPHAGGRPPVTTGLFWAPYLPRPGPAETPVSARPSFGQTGGWPQNEACPPRPGLPFLPPMDFSCAGGRPYGPLAHPQTERTAVPVLGRNAGGRAPPWGNA